MAKKHMKMLKKHIKNRHKRHHHEAGGLFVGAGLFIGLGLGLVYGNPGAGILIGLGAGIGLMALIQLLGKKKW